MLSNILDENNKITATIKGISSLECINNNLKAIDGKIYRGKQHIHVKK